MTVPPIPNRLLDCFDTVGTLTDLLLGEGLTGAEQEAVIAKTRAQFNDAYKDVIEELLGLELAKLDRAQTRATETRAVGNPAGQEPAGAQPADTTLVSPRAPRSTTQVIDSRPGQGQNNSGQPLALASPRAPDPTRVIDDWLTEYERQFQKRSRDFQEIITAVADWRRRIYDRRDDRLNHEYASAARWKAQQWLGGNHSNAQRIAEVTRLRNALDSYLARFGGALPPGGWADDLITNFGQMSLQGERPTLTRTQSNRAAERPTLTRTQSNRTAQFVPLSAVQVSASQPGPRQRHGSFSGYGAPVIPLPDVEATLRTGAPPGWRQPQLNPAQQMGPSRQRRGSTASLAIPQQQGNPPQQVGPSRQRRGSTASLAIPQQQGNPPQQVGPSRQRRSSVSQPVGQVAQPAANSQSIGGLTPGFAPYVTRNPAAVEDAKTWRRDQDGLISDSLLSAVDEDRLQQLRRIKRELWTGQVIIDPGYDERILTLPQNQGFVNQYPELKSYLMRHDKSVRRDISEGQRRESVRVGSVKLTFFYDPTDANYESRKELTLSALGKILRRFNPSGRPQFEVYISKYSGTTTHILANGHIELTTTARDIPQGSSAFFQPPYALGVGTPHRLTEHALIHELGHALAFHTAPHVFTDLEHTVWANDGYRRIAETASSVHVRHAYAGENPMEFVAEAFAALVEGRSLTREQWDMYQAFHGPMPLQWPFSSPHAPQNTHGTAEIPRTIQGVTADPAWQAARAAAPSFERSHLWVDPVSTPEGEASRKRFGVRSSFAVSRFIYEGQTFTDLTIRTHLRHEAPLITQHITRAQNTAQLAVDYLNSPGVFPPLSNSEVTVTLTFTDAKGSPHLTVDLVDDDEPMAQHRWQISADPIAYAHEIAHQLGLRDEYPDVGAAQRPNIAGSLMGQYTETLPDEWQQAGLFPGGLRQRHMQLLAQIIGDLPEPDTSEDSESVPTQPQPVPAPTPRPQPAPAERVGGPAAPVAGTGAAGQSTQRGPVPAFLDAPRPTAAPPSTERAITVPDQQPLEEVAASAPMPQAPHTAPVKATSPVAQGQPAPNQTQPVPTPTGQGTADSGPAGKQDGEVTPAQPSPQAEPLKELARLMLKTDMDTARDQFATMEVELEAAKIRQVNGTATGPCDLAVAEALFSLAKQQYQSATNSFNAIGG